MFEKLYPYQKDMVAEAIQKGGCLINGFCGSGKTVVSLNICTDLKMNKNLIVCPKSVLLNWRNEINRWLPQAYVVVATGSAAHRRLAYKNFLNAPEPRYLIMTYDALRIFMPIMQHASFDAVVFDEIHYCVNVQSKRYKACRALQAKVKYGLTATPIMNKATDIFGCLNVLHPGKLGNYYSFIYRYCNKDMWGSIKSYKNMDELQRRVSPYIVRKTWADAGHIEPPGAIDLEFELSKEETKLYNDIRAELLLQLEPMLVSKLSSPMILQNALTKLGKLQELVDYPQLIGELKQQTKLDVLKEHLENSLTDATSKCIIFTRFSRMAEILADAFSSYSPVLLTGQTNNRQDRIDLFTKDKTRKIFISTEAGGQGINLQAANIIYNYDLPFSLGKLEQRHGRLRHHMQDRPVFIYNLMAKLEGGKDSIDHFVARKLLKKGEVSDLLLSIKQLLQ
jgi:SNF2 family DNA or RNA helicase